MACGRFGFLVRLIDLMAVVQNAAGKSNLPHRRLGNAFVADCEGKAFAEGFYEGY